MTIMVFYLKKGHKNLIMKINKYLSLPEKNQNNGKQL